MLLGCICSFENIWLIITLIICLEFSANEMRLMRFALFHLTTNLQIEKISGSDIVSFDLNIYHYFRCFELLAFYFLLLLLFLNK